MKKRCPNVFITGFMGSGKSSVGKRLAKNLGWKFIDTDEEIEKTLGLTIGEIFEGSGEATFRTIETRILRKVARGSRQVIALGGGALLRGENQRIVKKRGFLVYLKTTLALAVARARKQPGKRPLLSGSKPLSLSKVRQLYLKRRKGYLKADMTVSTDELSLRDVVRTIQEHLEEDFLFGVIPQLPAKRDPERACVRTGYRKARGVNALPRARLLPRRR